ncbi:MAG: hypothetical protein K0S39_6054 [Paenibacillus sp.]|nr:hypothetical protein [Paenibacillus sp.]
MVHDDDTGKRTGYEDLFLLFSSLVEKWLVRTLLGLLVLLFIFQSLLQFTGIRYYLVKVEQLEGVSFNRPHEKNGIKND